MSRFGTYRGSIQGKKLIYYVQFLFMYFEQTLEQINIFPPRCEYTKYYYIILCVYIY